MTEFPLHFKSCPCCGHKGTVIAGEVETEKQANRLPDKAAIPIMQTRTAIFDPNRRSVLAVRNLAPGIVASYDVCSKCGNLYAVEVARVQVEFQMGTPLPSDGLIPPFMGAG